MASVNLLDFLAQAGSRGVDSCVEAYRAARVEAERWRREQFAAIGLPPGLDCPASLFYHLESRYSSETQLPLSDREATEFARSLDYKCYAGSTLVALPRELPPLEIALEEAIRLRRSHREFSDVPIQLEELSKLVGSAAGVTREGSIPRRSAPSAGALYPVEIYPWAFSVNNLAPALYHYATLTHSLEHVAPLQGRKDLWPVLDFGFQDSTPAVAFVLTMRLPRVQAKYGERGYRFALMESGHIAQNLLLCATALGLSSVPAGGFCDAGLHHLLGIDGIEEAATYVLLVGHPPECRTERNIE